MSPRLPAAPADRPSSQVGIRPRRSPTSVPVVAFGLPLDDSYGRQIFQGILAYLRKHPRWQIPVKNNTPYLPWNSLRRWRGDGIIGIFVSEEQFAEVERLGIPAINLSPPMGTVERLPTVRVDDRAIGVAVGEHLLRLGRKDFLFFGDPSLSFCRLRYEGFSTAIKAAGGRVSAEAIPLHPDVGQLIKSGWYMDAIRRVRKPAGVYGATDRIAFGVLEACRKRNLHVPSDVAVVGTNADDILCQLATPELSSVDAASFQVGYHAAHMLDYLMGRSSTAPELCLIPPGPIHVRASSDNLADTDPDLAAAIRFIREHATEPIYVPDVVRANRLSRRSLEILFRKFLNRSIADEIRLAQVNNVKSLLEKTSLTISEIARLSGFSSAVSLEAAFQKFLATSATAYRKASVSAAPGGAP
jgi:LacI family transcriptional regulator